MKVIYPVLFYEEEDGGYSVFVPDLNGATTCGETLEESMVMAEDLVAGIILDMVEEGEKIPQSTKIEKINANDYAKSLGIEDWNYMSAFSTYIVVDVSRFAEKWGKELVKKTVNIPKWVNSKAEELNINFSKTLEEALLNKIYKK